MNQSWLVNLASPLGLAALRLRVPLTRYMIEKTMFRQFCGGKTLDGSKQTIAGLWESRVATLLDFGMEGKNHEDAFEKTLAENLRAIEFAASEQSVPVVVTKISGLAANELLEKSDREEELSDQELIAYGKLENRLHLLASKASELGVSLFIDGEESWMQNTIDRLTIDLMAEFNKDRVVVYNTYQIYRWDKLADLKSDIEEGQKKGYKIGAKLVRGAYMDKERKRAELLAYKSPIHANKEAVDADYDEALIYCADRYEDVALCCASHNAKSNKLLADYIVEKKLPKDHPHLNFCQLQGMSDNLTFNLASQGYNVAKYVVYGPVKEVFPYLVRRAKENSSVTGDVSRELSMIRHEMKRRDLC